MKRDPGLGDALKAAIDDWRDPAIGRFRSETAALDFLRDRLVLTLKPEAIYLFGSRGRGEHRDDSDFDLLVVLPDELGDRARDYRYVLEPVLGSGLPCEVVPCSVSDFEEAKSVDGTIAHEAVVRGRQIYRKRAAKPAG